MGVEDGAPAVSMAAYARVTEELSRGWMSLAGAMGWHTVVAKFLTAFGTEEHKAAYLPKMATGEIRATKALTEPGGGSDLQAVATVAQRACQMECGRGGSPYERKDTVGCRQGVA